VSRGHFVVPIGGFGIAKVRERIQTALAGYVRYQGLRLRRRPRAVKVTICAHNDVAAVDLGGGEWTLVNSSATYSSFQVAARNFRAIRNVLPALVAFGLVTESDRAAFETWAKEEEAQRDRFQEYKRLRDDAERLGFKVIRASGDEARRRRAGGR
jgi:hypothetical protein